MKLFDKNKELILKILNSILLIWIVASFCISISNIVNIYIKEPQLSYKDYQVAYCNGIEDSECNTSYTLDNLYLEQENVQYKKSLIISIGNAVIVSGVLVLLNTKKKSAK